METPGLILSRAVAYLALLLVAGVPLFALTARKGASLPLRAALAIFAVTAGVASAWWALESAAAMAGTTLGQLDQQTAEAVLAATPLGVVMEWRLTALVAVVLATVLPLKALRVPVLALAGGAALMSMAWTGHAGASEVSGHLWADVIHLLAAATWIGALAVFLAQAMAGKADAAVLAAFARTGSVVVALLILTGVMNTLAIAGWPVPVSSRWAVLLAVKLALFALMLGLAAVNRWRIVPALERAEEGAAARLRRSIAMEAAAGLAVICVVAWLGVLDPAG